MASQVLSGSSNVSYTNNTGQNVRIVINYMASPTSMSWSGGSSSSTNTLAIGRNLAFYVGTSGAATANNASPIDAVEGVNFAHPTEIMLASGQTFSATCGAYNIVVIPEAG